MVAGLFNQSNQNVRNDSGRVDPVAQSRWANLSLGVQGSLLLPAGFAVGASVMGRFNNSPGSVLPQLDAGAFSADLIATFDAHRLSRWAPMRVHVNVGWLLDRSLNLLPAGQCNESLGNDSCIRSRTVDKFALAIGTDRLRTSFAIDFPFRIHLDNGHIIGLQPFFEYHVDVAVGDGDATMARVLTAQADSDFQACAGSPDATQCQSVSQALRAAINNNVEQFASIGFRVRPVAGLVIDVAADNKGTPAGFRYGPARPDWNYVIGLAYNFGGLVAR